MESAPVDEENVNPRVSTRLDRGTYESPNDPVMECIALMRSLDPLGGDGSMLNSTNGSPP